MDHHAGQTKWRRIGASFALFAAVVTVLVIVPSHKSDPRVSDSAEGQAKASSSKCRCGGDAVPPPACRPMCEPKESCAGKCQGHRKPTSGCECGHGHADGPDACKEAHESGKCEGHEPCCDEAGSSKETCKPSCCTTATPCAEWAADD